MVEIPTRRYIISWGVEINGLYFIELSAKDNQDRANYLAQLVDLLEQKMGITFRDLNKGKWRYDYPKDIFYLDTLKSFIDNEKPIIDEFITRHPQSGISMIDKEFNERYVLTLLIKKGKSTDKKGTKRKLEGKVSVSPSSYIMSLQHNELQNAMVDFLKTDKSIRVRTETGHVDITVKTASGETTFYELKTSDVKQAIRLAIGQLLEYAHYSNTKKADRLVIVTKYAPNEDDIVYIRGLRKLYQLPLYYQQFDMDKGKLSDLY